LRQPSLALPANGGNRQSLLLQLEVLPASPGRRTPQDWRRAFTTFPGSLCRLSGACSLSSTYARIIAVFGLIFKPAQPFLNEFYECKYFVQFAFIRKIR
jgi:hypothetical protein